MIFCNKHTNACFIIPPWTKFRGVYRNHSVCPSVCADLCPTHNFFMVWHLLTIFGTWVYQHKTMCRVHSWSIFDVDHWHQGQIYRLLSCLNVRPVTSVSLNIGIPYLGYIIMSGCVQYIHDPETTLTLHLKVKFIGFRTWLFVQASAFLSFDIVILCWVRECITMVRCVAYIY